MISKEAFNAWKEHPVTAYIIKEMQEVRNEVNEALATGAFLNLSDMESTFGNVSKATGYISGLDEFLNYDVDDGGEDA